MKSRILILLVILMGCSPDDRENDVILPEVSLVEITEITQNSAITGGVITDDLGSEIQAKGVCWSTSANPTIEDNFTNEGPGSDAFVSILSNLTDNTTFYVRAYATNSTGTSYSSELSFTTCGVFEGNVTLSSQQEVDKFGAEGYCEINGDLTIGHCTSDPRADITDLSPLNSIRKINGTLNIHCLDNLSRLEGLANLEEVGQDVDINGFATKNIDGLQSLTKVGRDLEISIRDLENVDGLSNLKEIDGSLSILFNYALTSISFLHNLEHVGFEIRIWNNMSLVNLIGLEKIEELGYLDIVENPLQSLEGLNNLKKVRHVVHLDTNWNLTDVDGLNGLLEIGNPTLTYGSLRIHDNQNLVDYCGLQPLMNNGFNNNGVQLELHDNGYNPSFGELLQGLCVE